MSLAEQFVATLSTVCDSAFGSVVLCLHSLLSSSVGLGPNVPKQRRDPTLPAWWTPTHDVRLLQVIVEETRGPRGTNATEETGTGLSGASGAGGAMATEADQQAGQQGGEDDEMNDEEAEARDPSDAPLKGKGKEGGGSGSSREVVGINWKRVVQHPALCRPLPQSATAVPSSAASRLSGGKPGRQSTSL